MMVTCCIVHHVPRFSSVPPFAVSKPYSCWSTLDFVGPFFFITRLTSPFFFGCAPVSVGSSQYLSNMPNDSGYPLVIYQFAMQNNKF